MSNPYIEDFKPAERRMTMNPVFEKQYEVGFNEADYDGMLRPVSILDWFQNTASSQSYALGIPVTDLISRGLTWVVSRYRLSIIKRSKWRDPVKVRTWRRPQLSDLSAPREFEIIAADGSVLVQATGYFNLIEIKTKKVISPLESIPNYPVLDKILFDNGTQLIGSVSDPDIEKKFDVRRSDLDMNRHVNNVNYVAWAIESVPDNIWENYWASEIEVSFKKSAIYPDSLTVKTKEVCHDPKPEFFHCIQRDGVDLASVKTIWTKR